MKRRGGRIEKSGPDSLIEVETDSKVTDVQ
jgi:hypothetical protein